MYMYSISHGNILKPNKSYITGNTVHSILEKISLIEKRERVIKIQKILLPRHSTLCQ